MLQRKHLESIWIGDDIKITVFIERGVVRIGITAPKGLEIDREEIRERKNEERHVLGGES